MAAMRVMPLARRSASPARASIYFLALVANSSAFRGSGPAFSNRPRDCRCFRSQSGMATSSTAAGPSGGAWKDDETRRRRVLDRCIVPLTAWSHKGSSGRVGVLGGSARYTGAPYYASMAALKAGADLAFCFCAQEAATPLKCYSPELMVEAVYEAAEFDEAVRTDRADGEDAERLVTDMVDRVCGMMNKMHSLVVGPGLGRCPLVLEATSRIIQQAQSKYRLPLVLDADALFLLTLSKHRTLLTDDSLVVLTPNAMERTRLAASSVVLPRTCLLIEKGAEDRIVPVAGTVPSPFESMVCDETGGLKRSGGIGDILAGTCGTLVAWNQILTEDGTASKEDLPLACWTACCFVKRSTKKAYDKHRRSMTAPDILQELGPTIDEMTSSPFC